MVLSILKLENIIQERVAAMLSILKLEKFITECRKETLDLITAFTCEINNRKRILDDRMVQ